MASKKKTVEKKEKTFTLIFKDEYMRVFTELPEDALISLLIDHNLIKFDGTEWALDDSDYTILEGPVVERFLTGKMVKKEVEELSIEEEEF